jgi:metal-responsive CopG/Arc/MetJ family transcriptional regulator
MKKNTINDDYVTLKIPKALADEIDLIIESGTLGYRSRAEMVNDAIRRRLEQIQSNNSTKNNNLNKSIKE